MIDTGVLAALYEDIAPALRRAGRPYPVAVDPLPGLAIEVEEATVRIAAAARALGARHLAATRRARPAVHDGELLALWSLRGPVVHVRRTSYFAMLATCDALRAELAAGGAGPMRDALHAAAGPDPVRSGRGRAAAVGVTVVTTVPDGRGVSFVLGRRRASLPTDPGRWHLVPSGMLEPQGPRPVEATVAQELTEELGLEGAASAACAGRLLPLGLAHDLARLRPDACYRLDLTATEAAAVRPLLAGPGNDEFDAFTTVPATRAGLAAFWAAYGPDALTPAAAGAVALLEATLG